MRPRLEMMNPQAYAHCRQAFLADGFGALRASQRGDALPLRRLTLAADIQGPIVSSRLLQHFVNPTRDALEVHYIFPLPAQAAVHGCRVHRGGAIVEAALAPRAEARRRYRDGGVFILEHERPEVLTLRLGRLGPGESLVVELDLVEALLRDGPDWMWRFPLVVAPRYCPGLILDGRASGLGTAPDTDAVPDASRISPPTRLPGFPESLELEAHITLHAPAAPATIATSLELEHCASEGLELRCRGHQRLDRDLILRWRAPEPAQATVWLAPDPERPDSGTALVHLEPPETTAPRRPLDLVVLLDVGRSMAGWKLDAARRAVAAVLETLTPDDRLALLVCDTEVRSPQGAPRAQLHSAHRAHLQAAVALLDQLEPSSQGCVLAAPLGHAAELVAASSRDRRAQLLVLSDGQVGNEAQILAHLSPRLGAHTTLHTLAVDSSANVGLLRRLAELGRGRCQLVERPAALQRAIVHLLDDLEAPAFTDLTVEVDGAAIVADSEVPRAPHALSASRYRPTSWLCRYHRAEAETRHWTVRARTPAGESVEIVARTARFEGGAERLRMAWAQRQLRKLDDRFDVADAPARPGARDELVATSLRHELSSRMSAWVGVDDDPDGDLGRGRPVVLPVERPEGWPLSEVEAAEAPAAAAVVADVASQLYRMNLEAVLDIDLHAFVRQRPAQADDLLNALLVVLREQRSALKQRVIKAIGEEQRARRARAAAERHDRALRRRLLEAHQSDALPGVLPAWEAQQASMRQLNRASGQAEAQRVELDRLKAALQALQAKIALASRRKHLVLAQRRRGEAMAKLAATLGQLDTQVISPPSRSPIVLSPWWPTPHRWRHLAQLEPELALALLLEALEAPGRSGFAQLQRSGRASLEAIASRCEDAQAWPRYLAGGAGALWASQRETASLSGERVDGIALCGKLRHGELASVWLARRDERMLRLWWMHQHLEGAAYRWRRLPPGVSALELRGRPALERPCAAGVGVDMAQWMAALERGLERPDAAVVADLGRRMAEALRSFRPQGALEPSQVWLGPGGGIELDAFELVHADET